MTSTTPPFLSKLSSMKLFDSRETTSPEELERVQDYLAERALDKLEPGTPLIHKNTVNDRMFLLVEGRLQVFLDETDSEPVAELGAGESVGEISLIDQQPTTAHVVAETPCTVLSLTLHDLKQIVSLAPSVMINLLYLLVQRQRKGNLKILEGEEKQREYEAQIIRDGLTEIYNRLWLDQTLPSLMKESHERRLPLVVGMVDVDHFKKFNDQHGHQAGDTVLQAVASQLQRTLRDSDRVARYGGEEFTLLLPLTRLKQARRVAERLRQSIATHTVTHEDETLPPVTISIGLTKMLPEDTPQTLLERADQALYQAKQNGRNRVETK